MTKQSHPTKVVKVRSGSLAQAVAVRFEIDPTRPELFVEALTHSSYAHEQGLVSNERLEFLGDSVLSLIISHFLWQRFPTAPEGELAKLKAILASGAILAGLTQQLELDQMLRLGAGEQKSAGQSKQNIQADLFEAFLGAYFLNFGLTATQEFLGPLYEPILTTIAAQPQAYDAKTQLQELTQAQGLMPEYRTISTTGPAHQRLFTVEVSLAGRILGQGSGASLKQAQHQAARLALAVYKTIFLKINAGQRLCRRAGSSAQVVSET